MISHSLTDSELKMMINCFIDVHEKIELILLSRLSKDDLDKALLSIEKILEKRCKINRRFNLKDMTSVATGLERQTG